MKYLRYLPITNAVLVILILILVYVFDINTTIVATLALLYAFVTTLMVSKHKEAYKEVELIYGLLMTAILVFWMMVALLIMINFTEVNPNGLILAIISAMIIQVSHYTITLDEKRN